MLLLLSSSSPSSSSEKLSWILVSLAPFCLGLVFGGAVSTLALVFGTCCTNLAIFSTVSSSVSAVVSWLSMLFSSSLQSAKNFRASSFRVLLFDQVLSPDCLRANFRFLFTEERLSFSWSSKLVPLSAGNMKILYLWLDFLFMIQNCVFQVGWAWSSVLEITLVFMNSY